jgi:hypothetical protein
MTMHQCAICAWMGTSLMSNCDAIVHAEVQMPDSSTSRALLDMQKSKVSGGMVVI